MSNSIKKEDLKWFGVFLRANNSIKTLSILNNEPRYFTNRLDFCYAVLKHLNEDKFLEVKSIEVEGYMGMVNPNMKDYKDETKIKMLCLAVYENKPVLKTDPSQWSLD